MPAHQQETVVEDDRIAGHRVVERALIEGSEDERT